MAASDLINLSGLIDSAKGLVQKVSFPGNTGNR